MSETDNRRGLIPTVVAAIAALTLILISLAPGPSRPDAAAGGAASTTEDPAAADGTLDSWPEGSYPLRAQPRRDEPISPESKTDEESPDPDAKGHSNTL